ncbi:MAG: nucleotidyltransferase domain-containing protein [Gemmatimonadota bacterium]|nr:nucleotidyltransferase domain-containing protein [Gemmatimonadota bacterium]
MNNTAAALRSYFENARSLGVQCVFLFGSHAAGTAHAESDIDVAVLLHPDRYRAVGIRDEERVRLSADLIGALHVNRMDAVILNDAPPGLARHIVTTGTRVFCPDPEAAHAITRDAMLRAADIDPFLNRMRRIALEHLRA